MSDTVIKIEHLSKMYKLGVINNGTLFRDMQSWWALKRGKEDPHAKIGADKYEGSDTEFWALKDLNFEIKQGDRIGIIGKNGAGKSTLLKILSRITTPTEGTVKIRGKVSSLLEVGTGFHGELTGRENIYLNGSILGMKKREIDRKLDEIIDFSGIEKHIDTPVKRYSSGMYVRLAFAVAAHLDSDILIADEVLAVGDAEFQKKAIGKMSYLSTSQGRTVLFVSHNMAAVKGLCNKGVILEKGKLKFQSDRIDEAIGAYLGARANTINNTWEFPLDETKEFQLLKFEIRDKCSERKNSYEATEIIRLCMKCISRIPLPDLYGYLAIDSVNFGRVIVCDSMELGNNVFSNMPVGVHTVEVTIPCDILSPGNYFPVLNFTSASVLSFNVDSPLSIGMFNVQDSVTKRGNTRGAITTVRPEWNIID